MRVIHGIWAHGSLCLWAEDPRLPAVPRSQGTHGSPFPAPHPFASQAGELADLLAAFPGPAGEAARKALKPAHDVEQLAEILRAQLPHPGTAVRQ